MQKVKAFLPILVILGLLFITIGDLVLPEPLKESSFRTRNSINEFMLSLVPSLEPKTRPYERTERALEEVQKSK